MSEVSVFKSLGSSPLFLVRYNLADHFKVPHASCLWACCSRCLEFLSAIFWPCKLLCILKIQLMYSSSDRAPPGSGVSLTKSVTFLLCSCSSIVFPCLFGSFLIISCVYVWWALGEDWHAVSLILYLWQQPLTQGLQFGGLHSCP